MKTEHQFSKASQDIGRSTNVVNVTRGQHVGREGRDRDVMMEWRGLDLRSDGIGRDVGRKVNGRDIGMERKNAGRRGMWWIGIGKARLGGGIP